MSWYRIASASPTATGRRRYQTGCLSGATPSPFPIAAWLILAIGASILSGCSPSNPPQGSTPSSAPAPKALALPVYPSCPGKAQPDYWSKPDAYYSNGVYTSARTLGLGHALLHSTMQYDDGHNHICDYYTLGLGSTITAQVWDPCEWTATHGNFADGRFGAPTFYGFTGVEGDRLPYQIFLTVIVSGYHGPGTYSLVDAASYRSRTDSSNTGKAAVKLTVRPDGSGSANFSGAGSYFSGALQKSVDTTISGLLTWTCDDPPWPIVTPTSADGSGAFYSNGQTATPLIARGALDYGNQRLHTESNSQEVTVTNSGLGPMWMHVVWTMAESHLKKPANSTLAGIAESEGFSVDGSDCTRAPLPVGATCRIVARFMPNEAGRAIGYFSIQYNSGASSRTLPVALRVLLSPSLFISLEGTGTATELRPLTVAPEESNLNADAACSLLGPIPEPGGWQPVNKSQVVQELRGEVVQGHVTTEDFTANHNSIDYNWFVYPDRFYRRLIANPANYATGDQLERGRIEVEWEKSLLPDFPGGIPSWAGPTQGDRVYVVGNWVVDCGHGITTGYRTEIHPPQVLVTYRNAALTPLNQSGARRGVSYNGQWATRADIFASNYGGLAIRSEGLGTDKVDIFSSRDYSFLVLAPSKPSPDAQLVMEVQQRQLPPQAIAGNVTFEELPDGTGYRGTIHFVGAADRLREVGETVYVSWKGGPDWWKPKTHTFRVTIQEIHLLDAPSSNFSAFVYVNEQYASMMRGSTTPLGVSFYGNAASNDVYCGAGGDKCKVPLQDNVLTVTVVDGQPLHIQVRGTAPHFLSLGTAYFLGTAEVTYTGDPNAWAGDRSQNAILAMAVGAEDSETVCTGNCFSIKLNVQGT